MSVLENWRRRVGPGARLEGETREGPVTHGVGRPEVRRGRGGRSGKVPDAQPDTMYEFGKDWGRYVRFG